jgi:hypothetical protein
MSFKINLLLNIAACWLLWGCWGGAFAASDTRNPFTFPQGVQKGMTGVNKEGGGTAKGGEPGTPAFRLTTIMISGQTKVAAINGTLVRIGDLLEGYRIEAIEDRQVVLRRGKERLNLPIDSKDRYSIKKKNQDNRLMGSSQ